MDSTPPPNDVDKEAQQQKTVFAIISQKVFQTAMSNQKWKSLDFNDPYTINRLAQLKTPADWEEFEKETLMKNLDAKLKFRSVSPEMRYSLAGKREEQSDQTSTIFPQQDGSDRITPPMLRDSPDSGYSNPEFSTSSLSPNANQQQHAYSNGHATAHQYNAQWNMTQSNQQYQYGAQMEPAVNLYAQDPSSLQLQQEHYQQYIQQQEQYLQYQQYLYNQQQQKQYHLQYQQHCQQNQPMPSPMHFHQTNNSSDGSTFANEMDGLQTNVNQEYAQETSQRPHEYSNEPPSKFNAAAPEFVPRKLMEKSHSSQITDNNCSDFNLVSEERYQNSHPNAVQAPPVRSDVPQMVSEYANAPTNQSEVYHSGNHQRYQWTQSSNQYAAIPPQQQQMMMQSQLTPSQSVHPPMMPYNTNQPPTAQFGAYHGGSNENCQRPQMFNQYAMNPQQWQMMQSHCVPSQVAHPQMIIANQMTIAHSEQEVPACDTSRVSISNLAPPGLAPVVVSKHQIISIPSNNGFEPIKQKTSTSKKNRMEGSCNQSLTSKPVMNNVPAEKNEVPASNGSSTLVVRKSDSVVTVSEPSSVPKNVEIVPKQIEIASKKVGMVLNVEGSPENFEITVKNVEVASKKFMNPSPSVNKEVEVVIVPPAKDVKISSQLGTRTTSGDSAVRDKEDVKPPKKATPKTRTVEELGRIRTNTTPSSKDSEDEKENSNLSIRNANGPESKKESPKPVLSFSEAVKKDGARPITQKPFVAHANTPSISSKPKLVDAPVEKSVGKSGISKPLKTAIEAEQSATPSVEANPITPSVANASILSTASVSGKENKDEQSTCSLQLEDPPLDEISAKKEIPAVAPQTEATKKNKKAKGKNAKKTNKKEKKVEENLDELLNQFAEIDARNPDVAKAKVQESTSIPKKRRTVSQIRRENAAKKTSSPRVEVTMESDIEIDEENYTLEDWQEQEKKHQLDDEKWKDSMKFGFEQFMEDLNRSVSDQTPLEYWPDCPLFDRCEDPEVTADRRSRVCFFLKARITEDQKWGGTIPYMRRSLYANLVQNYNANLGAVIEPFMLLYSEEQLTTTHELKLIAKIVNVRECKNLDCDIMPAFR